jgi:hypothetical protein
MSQCIPTYSTGNGGVCVKDATLHMCSELFVPRETRACNETLWHAAWGYGRQHALHFALRAPCPYKGKAQQLVFTLTCSRQR